MLLRLQENSSLMGRTKTPTPLRAPMVIMMTKKDAATMNQP